LWHVNGAGGDIILALGPEPSLRWKLFSQQIISVAEQFNSSLLLTLGSLLADVPHSRPVQIIGTATDADLIERFDLQRSRYEGPVGIVSVLHDTFDESSIPSASLWAAVPAYASQVPSPKASLALMRRACEVIGTPAPLATVMNLIERYEEQIDSLVKDDDDLVAYVERLETMTDNGMSLDDEVDDNQLQFDFAGDTDEPADPSNLMDEVEQFLREQNGN
jgi:proteasome assembly chaperone (PAC2) family protein